MTCRVEILQAIRALGTPIFSVEDIVGYMLKAGTQYQISTIRNEVASRLCVNSPANHKSRYPDLERVSPGKYRLVGKQSTSSS